MSHDLIVPLVTMVFDIMINKLFTCQCRLLLTFANSLDPAQGLIFVAWSGSKLWHSYGIPELFFFQILTPVFPKFISKFEFSTFYF